MSRATLDHDIHPDVTCVADAADLLLFSRAFIWINNQEPCVNDKRTSRFLGSVASISAWILIRLPCQRPRIRCTHMQCAENVAFHSLNKPAICPTPPFAPPSQPPALLSGRLPHGVPRMFMVDHHTMPRNFKFSRS